MNLVIRHFTFDTIWPDLRSKLYQLTRPDGSMRSLLVAYDGARAEMSRVAIVAFDFDLPSPLDKAPLGWSAVWWGGAIGTLGVFVRDDVRGQGIGCVLVSNAVRLGIGLSVELHPGDRIPTKEREWLRRQGV